MSSFEASVRVLTPTGSFVEDLALPDGVSSLSGIGLDDRRGEAFVSGTSGTVWRLGGFPMAVPRPSLSYDAVTGTVTWNSQTGYSYELQFSSLLTVQSWSTLAGGMPGTGGVMMYEDAVEGQSWRFYRLRVTEATE